MITRSPSQSPKTDEEPLATLASCRDRQPPTPLWCEGLSVSPPSAKDLSPIPKAPKAQCASLGCDLIRSSNCHPDLTPEQPTLRSSPAPRSEWNKISGQN